MTRIYFVLSLALAVVASTLAAQEEAEPRQERRIKVVFSDGTTGEEEILVDSLDGGAEIILAGDHNGPLQTSHLLRPRTYLGVQLLEITPELRTHFGADPEAGLLISSVQEESPAASAGVLVGDVLTTVDGEPVTRASEVIRTIAKRDVDDTIALDVLRDRRPLSLEATLAERDRVQVDLAPMFWTPAEGEHRIMRLPGRVIEIEKGDLDEAFTELHERLESPEWRQRLSEMTSRRQGLEERIRELEERLREMEERLDKESD